MLGKNLHHLEEISGKPYEDSPSAGFWYAGRYPNRWELEFFRTTDYTENAAVTYQEWWQREIADKLATAWAPVLKVNVLHLLAELRELPHGLPRGYVTLNPDEIHAMFTLGPATGLTRADIERAFGLSTRFPVWKDSLEKASDQDDRRALRELLHIQEDWASQIPRESA